MLLGEFSQTTKENFWKLANNLVLADRKVTPEEEEMLEAYRNEMKLDSTIYSEAYDLDPIIQEMAKETSMVKRAIFFELLGLAYADAHIADEEKEILSKIQREFAVSDEKRKELELCVKEVMRVYNQISLAVGTDK